LTGHNDQCHPAEGLTIMFYPINDVQAAFNAHNDRLREAEHDHLVRSVQRQQPNPLHQLQSQLTAWADTVRPQRQRAQRAWE
jgi:hypothetical protein